MKKDDKTAADDDLRSEYDASVLKKGCAVSTWNATGPGRTLHF